EPLARNTVTPAKSSITPQRPAGVRRSTRSFRLGNCCRPARVKSVSTQPGSTAFTWTLSRAHAESHCCTEELAAFVEHSGKLRGRRRYVNVCLPSAIIFGSKLSLTMPFRCRDANGGLSNEIKEHRLRRPAPVRVGSGVTASNRPRGASGHRGPSPVG